MREAPATTSRSLLGEAPRATRPTSCSYAIGPFERPSKAPTSAFAPRDPEICLRTPEVGAEAGLISHLRRYFAFEVPAHLPEAAPPVSTCSGIVRILEARFLGQAEQFLADDIALHL